MVEERKAKGTSAPTCSICGKPHWARDPHQWDKPSGTKEQRIAIADDVLAEKDSRAKAPKAKPASKRKAASPPDGGASRPSRRGGSPAIKSEPPIEPITKRGRGRPRTITDMRAYKTAKERERRAKAKAEKGNPDAV